MVQSTLEKSSPQKNLTNFTKLNRKCFVVIMNAHTQGKIERSPDLRTCRAVSKVSPSIISRLGLHSSLGQ